MSAQLKNISAIFIFIFSFGVHSSGQLFKLATTFKDLDAPVTCMSLGFDDTKLITGDSAGNIIFRNPDSGTMISRIKTFNSPVDNINFNSTGKLMIVTSREGEIKIYDFNQEKFIQSLYSPAYTDMRFALFSIADGFIYFNGQGRLYKTRSDLTQPVEKIYESDSIITNAVITNDRSSLIFSCGNSLKVLNTRTDNITQEIVTSSAKIEQVAFSTDNKLVCWSDDGTIVIRKYELNQLHTDLLGWFKAGTSSKLAFSHNGSMMVTGRVGTWARIWKPFDRVVMQELFGHRGEVTNFAFSADDQTLFTASNDKSIIVWKQKPADRKLIEPTADNSSKTIVSAIAPIPPVNPTTILTGSNDSSLPIIELNKENIPSHVGGRNVDKTTIVEVSSPTIDIYVYDNSALDGDVMSLSFQNQWILTHYEVTRKKKKITIQLKPDSNNYLVLFADNLGKTPPNTAAISFDQKGRKRIFRLESDLKSCSAVNFIYKSK